MSSPLVLRCTTMLTNIRAVVGPERRLLKVALLSRPNCLERHNGMTANKHDAIESEQRTTGQGGFISLACVASRFTPHTNGARCDMHVRLRQPFTSDVPSRRLCSMQAPIE